jgi:hypothetical protein
MSNFVGCVPLAVMMPSGTISLIGLERRSTTLMWGSFEFFVGVLFEAVPFGVEGVDGFEWGEGCRNSGDR